MTGTNIPEAIAIQEKLNEMAQEILNTIEEHYEDSDGFECIAALAIASCAIARASKVPLSKISEAIAIAHRQISEV